MFRWVAVILLCSGVGGCISTPFGAEAQPAVEGFTARFESDDCVIDVELNAPEWIADRDLALVHAYRLSLEVEHRQDSLCGYTAGPWVVREDGYLPEDWTFWLGPDLRVIRADGPTQAIHNILLPESDHVTAHWMVAGMLPPLGIMWPRAPVLDLEINAARTQVDVVTRGPWTSLDPQPLSPYRAIMTNRLEWQGTDAVPDRVRAIDVGGDPYPAIERTAFTQTGPLPLAMGREDAPRQPSAELMDGVLPGEAIEVHNMGVSFDDALDAIEASDRRAQQLRHDGCAVDATVYYGSGGGVSGDDEVSQAYRALFPDTDELAVNVALRDNNSSGRWEYRYTARGDSLVEPLAPILFGDRETTEARDGAPSIEYAACPSPAITFDASEPNALRRIFSLGLDADHVPCMAHLTAWPVLRSDDLPLPARLMLTGIYTGWASTNHPAWRAESDGASPNWPGEPRAAATLDLATGDWAAVTLLPVQLARMDAGDWSIQHELPGFERPPERSPFRCLDDVGEDG